MVITRLAGFLGFSETPLHQDFSRQTGGGVSAPTARKKSNGGVFASPSSPLSVIRFTGHGRLDVVEYLRRHNLGGKRKHVNGL